MRATPKDPSGAGVPDRLRLPFVFDPRPLEEDLKALERSEWVDHFIRENYDGRWTVLPLRVPAGTEDAHPVLQSVSHPDQTDFVDTPLLRRCPAIRAALDTLDAPLAATRLMRLDPGSAIHTHVDPGLGFESGWVRLHVPVATNPGVEFVVNGRPVAMHPGECWYLRLSDPHSVRNAGVTPRVHLVIDAPVGPRMKAIFERAVREAVDGYPASS